MAPEKEERIANEAAEHLISFGLKKDDEFVRMARELGPRILSNSQDADARQQIFDFIKNENKRREKSWFGPKLKIIDDICFALRHDELSKRAFGKLRRKYKIPPLDSYTDILLFDRKDSKMQSPSRSLFWHGKGLKKERAFDKDIRALIDGYEYVPMALFWWVKHVIMYPESLIQWQPPNDVSLLTDLLKNRKDLKKLPLTDAEERHLSSMAQSILGLKSRFGRPKKGDKKMQMYSAVSTVIHSSPRGKLRGRRVTMSPRARKIFLLHKEGKSYAEIICTLDGEGPGVFDAEEEARRAVFEVRNRVRELTKRKVRN